MQWVTPLQCAEAKRVNTFVFLQARYPGVLRRTAPDEYRLAEHDSLVLTPSNGKWHWKSRQVGGVDPVNFLMKVWGVPYPEAVLEVLGEREAVSFQPREPPQKQRKAFELPPRSPVNDRAIAYLMQCGIAKEVIDACIREGNLYESRGHRPNCVFVGTDSAGMPRSATLRGIDTDFKRDAPGSEKRHGFCLGTSASQQRVAVFESPIDALSLATIHRANPAIERQWRETAYLSLGGTAPLALLQHLRDRPNVTAVYLFLDSDRAGREGTTHICKAIEDDARLTQQVRELTSVMPPFGKDYNEYLLHLRQKQTSREARAAAPER